MTTTKINKENVKLIAHRGLSGLERENTNAAFVAAGNRSYFGIETDVHRTKSGEFVIIHDNDMLRVSGKNIAVETSNYADLKNVTLYDMQGTKQRADLKIPLLREYVSICQSYDKVAVLEFKSDFTSDELIKIIEILNEQGHLDKTVFISFIADVLIRLREILPTHPMQFLTGEYSEELVALLVQHKMDLDIYFEQLTKERVGKLHSAGIKVNCWTVDSKEQAEALISMGVDFITTNILE